MPICPRCGVLGNQLGALCPSDGACFVREDALGSTPNHDLLGIVLEDIFAVISFLGEGAMGTVYEVVHIPDGRLFALKFFKHDPETQSILHKRFIREAEIVANLTHANIVSTYTHGLTSDGVNYIVMELVKGRSLSEYEPYNTLEMWHIIAILEQMLSAMIEAHGLGIVHRDIKPDNILISASETRPCFVKILDFGLAKLLQSEAQTVLTTNGEIYGTPVYMSPEQALAGANVLPAADIYSMGVIAYEMLTGAPPFRANNPLATIMQHTNLSVPPLKCRDGIQVSKIFENFVLTCLSKRPEHRYPDAMSAVMELAMAPEVDYLIANSPDLLPYFSAYLTSFEVD